MGDKAPCKEEASYSWQTPCETEHQLSSKLLQHGSQNVGVTDLAGICKIFFAWIISNAGKRREIKKSKFLQDMIERAVHWTNVKMKRSLDNLPKCQKKLSWMGPVDEIELRAFFGLMYVRGALKHNFVSTKGSF